MGKEENLKISERKLLICVQCPNSNKRKGKVIMCSWKEETTPCLDVHYCGAWPESLNDVVKNEKE